MPGEQSEGRPYSRGSVQGKSGRRSIRQGREREKSLFQEGGLECLKGGSHGNIGHTRNIPSYGLFSMKLASLSAIFFLR